MTRQFRVTARHLWLLVALAASGCGLPSQALVTPVTFREALTVVENEKRPRRVVFSGFEAVKEQCLRLRSSENPELPEQLVRCSLMKKLLDCVDDCLYSDQTRVLLDASTDDYEEFLEIVTKTSTRLIDQGGEGASPSSRDRGFTRRWLYYLNQYVRGDFVDRMGARYSRPNLGLSGVDNESIVGIVTATLEALYDHSFALPVYYTHREAFEPEFKKSEDEDPDLYRQVFRKVLQRDYFNTAGRIPTSVGFDDNARPVATGGRRGITESEVRAVQFVAGLSEEQSKALSGLLLRLFGDIEVSFVVGGHFSVGDNDTLARLAETVVGVSARRATEAAAYKFFEEYTSGTDGKLQEIIELSR